MLPPTLKHDFYGNKYKDVVSMEDRQEMLRETNISMPEVIINGVKFRKHKTHNLLFFTKNRENFNDYVTSNKDLKGKGWISMSDIEAVAYIRKLKLLRLNTK